MRRWCFLWRIGNTARLAPPPAAGRAAVGSPAPGEPENAECPPICGKATVGGHHLPSSRCRMKKFFGLSGSKHTGGFAYSISGTRPRSGSRSCGPRRGRGGCSGCPGRRPASRPDSRPRRHLRRRKGRRTAGCLPTSAPPARRCRCRRKARRLRHAVRESLPVRRGPDHSSG